MKIIKTSYYITFHIYALTLFRMGLFGAAHGWWVQTGPLPKICHTYHTKMKLGSYTLPKEGPKNI